MKKDLLSLFDLDQEEIFELLSLTDTLRSTRRHQPMLGKTAALLFQKPSLRTRVSFEVGVSQLGGSSIFMGNEGVGLGVRESVSDVAQVLSGYVDVIIARLFDHSLIEELAASSSIPVINALTDLSHPCQILADLYTIQQHGKLTPNLKVAFIGDGNNVANSWIELAGIIPMHFMLAHPEGYGPDAAILAKSQAAGISTIELVNDPKLASENADVLYTDVWMSMGQEHEGSERKAIFKEFQINQQLLEVSHDDSLVMHCLPAHRGEEISEQALAGKHSVIFEQAENRLHVQKAILAKLVGHLSARPTYQPVEWQAGVDDRVGVEV
jgi:ornithine carbamoyltransferase